MRGVVLDLTGLNITRGIEDELEDLIGRLPKRIKIVDVSVVAEPEKRERLQKPGLHRGGRNWPQH